MSELVINPGMRVSEVAARYPQALRMLEALGIDYRCGGKRPLAEGRGAGKGAGETAITVLQTAITRPPPRTPGSATGRARGTGRSDGAHRGEAPHLHPWELPRLEKMAALVAHVHGPNHR